MTTPHLIIDLEAYDISAEEVELLKHPTIAGIILFSRNYHLPQQLKNLCDHAHRINPDLIIMVDQEGGRVQRFREGFTTIPPMSKLNDKQALCTAITTLASELKSVGVDMSLTPVLDLDYSLSEVIGERSLGRTPEQVTDLAEVLIETLHQQHMPSVGKHFPGHGKVTVDSHKGLPVDPRTLEELVSADLYPYLQLFDVLDAIMMGHLLFPTVDDLPASLSPIWIKHWLRQEFRYEGCIMTDDLSMEALQDFGDYPARTWQALQAGCDLALICNNRVGAVAAMERALQFHDTDSHHRVKRLKTRMQAAYG